MMRQLMMAFNPQTFSSFPLLFLLTILLLHLCATAPATTINVDGNSNETDHQALLHFKSKITADPFAVLTSWNSSIHFCQWYGVRCGRRHQRITRLVLRSSKLSGTISSYVGNLSFLRVLDLQNNSFSNEIPQEIGHLRKLEYLFLNDNTVCGKIPFKIFSLSNLLELNLGSNQLVGKIHPLVGSLSNLQLFKLRRNYLTDTIPSSFGNLSHLVKVDLTENLLVGSIPDSFSQLGNLEILNLAANKLSGVFPPSIFYLSSLSSIDLASNDLSGNLSSDLFISLPNIIYFSIFSNRISGPIPTSLSNSSNMESLQLIDNQFTGGVPYLSNVQKLRRFAIYSNNLGSGEANELSFLISLSNATMLEILDIGNNSFGGVLSQQIGNFSKKLWTFGLWYNKIQGSIPSEIGNLINLEVFDVSENQLSGIIPSTIGKLTKLKELWLLRRRKALVLNDQDKTILQLSYHNLYEATEGFSSANLIGEGSFGSVYKGTLALLETGRTVVAVKVLNLARFGAFKSFKAECEALKNIRHRNLVRVLTVCSSVDSQGNDFRALVYEFMVNGSLEEWLHHHPIRRVNLLQRLHIAIDVACALDYLHHQNETPIVHCDVKPSNILLDGEMTAHVGDFGLARFLVEAPNNELNGNQSSSVGVRETVGYAPPEYGMGNKVAISGDVYSYGILLLEMFTGKRPLDEMFTEGLNLHNFVKSSLPEQVAGILDPVLHQEIEVQNRRILTSSSTQRIEELLDSHAYSAILLD